MPIYRGTMFQHAFVLKNQDGVAIPMTGWEFRMQIRKSANDTGEPLLELTTANGGIFVHDVSTGTIMIVLDEAQTLSLPTGGYKFDVLRTDQASGGGPTWLFGGKLKVKQPVTHDA